MRIGVVSVQGAFPEHISSSVQAMRRMGVEGEAVPVRRSKDLEGVDALIIPGGESTTIAKLLWRFHLSQRLLEMAEEGVPIMGTCAGLVLLAKEGDDQVQKTETRLLGLMDMAVDRNAFGRQRESFEAELEIDGLDKPFPAVFIRAPVITRVWGGCRILSRYQGSIVMARQENLLALSFHPELSHDTRIHEMLVSMARR
ncbi:MAG: pyridoxal 5'-phosphate synthase glutaminase subunit PdxT [Methanomassiliicoccales archaeon]|jgi:5'-phosphate synthase pdxT subunit|nr:pyridoxal 5'-phosphate synthase glutaminase subunit PdxT [Methanomassiliicoccales archaeon]